MCIPPFNEDSEKYFLENEEINKKLKLKRIKYGNVI